MALRNAEAGSDRDRRLREQATILVVGIAAAVALLRLFQGPVIPVLKLEAFGLADVAAYQEAIRGFTGDAGIFVYCYSNQTKFCQTGHGADYSVLVFSDKGKGDAAKVRDAFLGAFKESKSQCID